MADSRPQWPDSALATGPAELSRCEGCGSTLTGAFRFCPGCGRPGEDYGWPQADTAISFPVVERPERRRRKVAWSAPWSAVGRSATRLSASVARAPRRLRTRASRLGRPSGRRALGVAGALRETARLLADVVVVSAGSVRTSLRSMVLLQRLHERRAALIHAAGYAALAGEGDRMELARSEVRMLDELIMVASGRMPRP